MDAVRTSRGCATAVGMGAAVACDDTHKARVGNRYKYETSGRAPGCGVGCFLR